MNQIKLKNTFESKAFKGLIRLLIITFVSCNILAADLEPSALKFTGIYDLRDRDPNLTGKNVRVGVVSRSYSYTDGIPQNDYKPNYEHRCLDDKLFEFFGSDNSYDGLSEHSMGVSSVLFGFDENAFENELGEFVYEGALPQAESKVYEFSYFLDNFINDNSTPEVDILNTSWGVIDEEWWTRGLDRLAEKTGTIIVSAAGNGSEMYDPVLYPAGNANTIGVGVISSTKSEDLHDRLSNFGLVKSEFSSIGPTFDGRCKPDLVAPGNCLSGSFSDNSEYYELGDWSSFATPVVSGVAGLLLQKASYFEDMNSVLTGKGRNCVVKAILLNSARKLPYWHKGKLSKDDDHVVPLDYLQGAGIADALAAVENLEAGIFKPGNEFVGSAGWDSNKIRNGNEKVYRILLDDPNEKNVTVTLTWNFHYEDQFPFDPVVEKNSDLRLEVWAVYPEANKNSYLIDYSDSPVDNVEHVHFKTDPNIKEYEIILRHNRESRSQKESYALAWRTQQIQNFGNEKYDLNMDGIISADDVYKIVENMMKSKEDRSGYYYGDIDSNGVIDFKDVQIFLEQTNILSKETADPNSVTS